MALVWYARAGAAVRGAKRRPLRSPSSAAALARGDAVCGADVFDDFIGLAFQRGDRRHARAGVTDRDAENADLWTPRNRAVAGAGLVRAGGRRGSPLLPAF